MARRNAATTDTVDPVDALPTETLSGSIPAVLGEAVEFYRWDARKSRADVLKEALTEWATNRDLISGARERLAAKVEEEKLNA